MDFQEFGEGAMEEGPMHFQEFGEGALEEGPMHFQEFGEGLKRDAHGLSRTTNNAHTK